MSEGLAWYNPASWFGNNTTGYTGDYISRQVAANDGTSENAVVSNTSGNQLSNGLASIGNIGKAAQGLAGLANAYLGYKNYQLAKNQFDYERASSNANLYNQGTLVNNQLDKSAAVGNALAGNTMTEAQRQASLADAANRHVKTTI